MNADHESARRVATEAGRRLLELRACDLSPSALKAEGDRRSHEFILQQLTSLYPDDAVLSEEAPDDRRRMTEKRVWIVDPLDGTREYSEVPRQDWAVHVALVVDGELVAGAVALPGQGRTLSTGQPPEVPSRPDCPLRLVVSRTRPAAHAQALALALDAELVPMGSAGAKVAAIICGEADVYAHSGGQYEWDSAAPVAVAVAAGLHASRLDGSALQYNQRDPWLPDLLVCRSELAETVLTAVKDLGS
jgi:3'(2'), 5'-bisphosphate nucleotidase